MCMTHLNGNELKFDYTESNTELRFSELRCCLYTPMLVLKCDVPLLEFVNFTPCGFRDLE